MRTEKQISNAYDRAAAQANRATGDDQTVNFAETPEKIRSELGSVQCAAGFAAQALAKLDNGDLDGFYASLRLAGQFAAQADDLRYKRTHK